MEFLRRNLTGTCLLILGMALISEAWVPGSVQKFANTVRHEITVHKTK